MNILLGIAGFLVALIAVAGIILFIIAIVKGKIKTPGAPSGKILKTIAVIVILSVLGWFGYRYFTGLPSHQQAPAVAQQQWQLCWEKKPEYEGKTPQRDKCLSAKIESRNESHIIISYSGGRGIQEGTSTDGKNYDGEWRDSTGWGKWHLKFVSSDTAFGWSDDEGKGEKQPNVLGKIKT
jgi:hypothetical protein